MREEIKGINGVETNLLGIEIEDLKKYVGIGFCQPKFYTSTAWNRAKKCMTKLCEMGLVMPHDYGRGKGKYTTTVKGNEIDFNKIYLELVKIDFTLNIRKR